MTKKAMENADPAFRLLHTKAEAAQMLAVSLRTIDNLIAFKQLPVRRIGRRVLVSRATLLNFAKGDRPPTAAV